jgi:hypothetical protein
LAILLAALPLAACNNSKPQPTADQPANVSEYPLLDGPNVTPDSDAATWLTGELMACDDVLYVYKDFADGANRYTQKSWMGDDSADVPEMDEASQGYGGSTGIKATINLARHTWGGYYFQTGILAAGSTQPQNDFGSVDGGEDLTGATRLTFYARGAEGGEVVQFFVGGLGIDGAARAQYADSTNQISSGFITLSDQWQRYEIALDGADLSRIAGGFGWVAANNANPSRVEVAFYLDEIRFEFAPASSRRTPILLASYEPAAPGTDAGVINNFAYTYDNAVTLIALARAGQTERALQIADALVYCIDNDRYFSDGRLRNAYINGDVRSFNGWLSPRGQQFARLPGFWDLDDKQWYEDYYAVSTSTGNCAWAILALCEAYRVAPEHPEYLQSAKRLGDFVLTLATSSGAGGFTAGFEGWEGEQVQVGYKSTEHNIDLVAAYRQLAELSDGQQAAAYMEASEQALTFVLAMYDAKQGCFYTGTGDDGVTPNTDVLPLDCQTWAVLALGDSLPASSAQAVMAYAQQNMATSDGLGYDFNTDQDGVWYEGTAQAALAWQALGDEESYQAILNYLNQSTHSDGSITAANHDGTTTGFTVSGLDIPWLYDQRTHIGATAWLSLAQQSENPFTPANNP